MLRLFLKKKCDTSEYCNLARHDLSQLCFVYFWRYKCDKSEYCNLTRHDLSELCIVHFWRYKCDKSEWVTRFSIKIDPTAILDKRKFFFLVSILLKETLSHLRCTVYGGLDSLKIWDWKSYDTLLYNLLVMTTFHEKKKLQ